MAKKKVISIKQIPTRPPIITTIAVIALLKAYEVSEVVWAVSITILAVIWIILLVSSFLEEQTEIKL